MHPTLPRILAALEGVRQTGETQWEGHCPLHDDQRPSLSVGIGDDGRVLLHDHAGCKTEDICRALGLKVKDLMPPKMNGRASRSDSNGKPKAVAYYSYRDVDENVLYQNIRYEEPGEPKTFRVRQRKPDGTWQWNLKGVRKVPYRLRDLIRSKEKDLPVFKGNGEKAVDFMRSKGLIATCFIAGEAVKWWNGYTDYFVDRKIVILADNDDTGRDHAERVARNLYPVAKAIKVVHLPGLPPKGDVVNWFEQGHTMAEFAQVVKEAPAWEPKAQQPDVTEKRKPASEPGGLHHALTDTGLAERFAEQHATEARYCHAWRKWLTWDGQRWRVDDSGAVDRMAKQTARSILEEAISETDGDKYKQLVDFARSAESANRRAAMIQLARSEPGIPVAVESLDRDPWLLNVENGTLDLQTGELREHRPADNITKLAPVDFQGLEAEAPNWLDFRASIFCGKSSLDRFMQRLAGYCLTGVVRDQILAILYGTGANGKSTLLNVWLDMLGADYGMKAVPELLMARRGEQHPTEKADLHGKRLVVAVETGEGRRLAESLVKELTGGDRIRARRMREDHWEFSPTHKLVLATNHKPRVQGTDRGIWRRLKLIPFALSVPEGEQDKALPEKLQAELPGILAWAVQGCLDWQRDGLGEPEEVRAATDEYRASEDVLGAFISECCVVDKHARAKAGDLLSAYHRWAGDTWMTQRRLGQALAERDFTKRPSGGYVLWLGIGLLADHDL